MGIAAALLIGAMLLGSPPKPTRLRAIEVRGVAISEGLELGRPGFAGTEGCAGGPEVGIRLPQTSPPLAPPGPPPTTKVLEALRADLPAWMESALSLVPVFAVARDTGREPATIPGKDGKPEVVFFPDRAAAEAWRIEHSRADPSRWAESRVAAYRLAEVASRHLARVAPYRSIFQGSTADLRAAEGLPATVGTAPFACPVFVVRLSDGRYPTLVAKGSDPIVPVHLAYADAVAMRDRVDSSLEAPTTARVETMDLSTVLRLMLEARTVIATRFRPSASAANLKAGNDDPTRPEGIPKSSPQN